MKFIYLLLFASKFSLQHCQESDEDSIVVEALILPKEESSERRERQFVSVTGFGQYPGFPSGWPFVQHPPVQMEQVPTPTMSPTSTKKPITPPSESCVTVRGEHGRCTTMRQCYPVLYTLTYADNTTNNADEILRNPGLAEILRSDVSGPCDQPNDIVNQFLFRADAEFRRKLICCPNDPPKQPLQQQLLTSTTPTTTTTTTMRTTPKQIYNPPSQRPQFGHRPPTPEPGKRTTTTQPVVASSCGIPKIVGGVETVAGKYPWMVALMNGPKQFCGGSLIADSYILTASHCISHMRPDDVARIRVLLGAHNIYRITSGTVVKKVTRVVRHRFFSHQTLHNDVAVLKLDSPVKFTDYISPICLARGQNRFANHQATVAGWGSVGEHAGQPQTLREVTIEIWRNENCKQKYGSLAPGGITDHMVCAGGSQSRGGDACRGDSGGPLFTQTGSYYEQIGIVSWGIGCGRYPGVYSRVTDFLGWITKNIQ